MTDSKDTTKPSTTPAQGAKPVEATPTNPEENKNEPVEAAVPKPETAEIDKSTETAEQKLEAPAKKEEKPAEETTKKEAETNPEAKSEEGGDLASIEQTPAVSTTKPFSTVEINKLAKQLDQQFSHDELDATIDVKVPKTAIYLLLLGLVLIIGLGIMYALL